MLGEDPKCESLPNEVALPGHDHHAVALLARFLLECGRDLAMDRIAEVGEEETERAGPADTEAAGGGIRDVEQFRGGGLDQLTGSGTDPGVVGEGA